MKIAAMSDGMEELKKQLVSLHEISKKGAPVLSLVSLDENQEERGRERR
jgi:hypothetical protein